MPKNLTMIDLFAGAGGLSEGFIRAGFKPVAHVEMDKAACNTLRTRAVYYSLKEKKKLPIYYKYLKREITRTELYEKAPEALSSVIEAPIGAETNPSIFEQVQKLAGNRSLDLLVGGPPCQAYSLAGRSRNKGIESYRPKDDERHFLYREYCRVLNELSPAAFVMENVKGMLSSSVGGLAIFEQVMSDLQQAEPGYRLVSLAADMQPDIQPKPKDFVIRAEDHGVPQARHRVIIVGIRSDIETYSVPQLRRHNASARVNDMLTGLPRLRSGLSTHDNELAWYEAVKNALETIGQITNAYYGNNFCSFRDELDRVQKRLVETPRLRRTNSSRKELSENLQTELTEFLDDPNLVGVSGHETRSHMRSDLARYLFAACFAKAEGLSPRAHQFPDILAPNHKNWKSGKFNDRFRVQVGDASASTITSHISKDGHYFIHPDPTQCRSLTVREAARLQTFPDNYHFMGNRTEQFVQVGNAVPPFLALQIAQALLPVFEGIA